MKHKILYLLISSLILIGNLKAKEVIENENSCHSKGENFIFVSNECLETFSVEGDDNEDLIILIHGSWEPGTNILGRYSPFVESLNLETDKTVVAVALPGYSNSTSNSIPPLLHNAKISPAATKEYVKFLGEVITILKNKFSAQNITYVGHSAGAVMGATLTGVEPNLIQNIVLVGGRYNASKAIKNSDAIFFKDVMHNSNKKSTHYVLIYGGKDKISPPQVTIDMYTKMKKDGFQVTLVEAKDAPHLDLEMTNATINAIVKLFD